MAFNIDISDKVKFPVRFTTKDEKGVERPGKIEIHAHRLSAEEFKERMESCGLVYADFLATVVFGWDEVRNGDGVPVEFSEEALRRLCKMSGMAHLIWKVYTVETSVKEKN